MVFEHIEKLKREYTDKYVVVDGSRPELKRFDGHTGQIKTVNMSGRALVQFDVWNNIGWYDIELDFLKVVPKPEPGAAQEKVKERAPPAAVNDKSAVIGEPGVATTDTEPPPSRPGVPVGKPSTADILAAARARKAATPAAEAPADKPKPAASKPSTADILAAARAKQGTTPAPAPKTESKKPSTADILAAARANKAAAAAPSPAAAQPAVEEVAAEPTVEEPEEEAVPEVAAAPAKAKTTAAGPVPTTTAEKIAWCRTHDAK